MEQIYLLFFFLLLQFFIIQWIYQYRKAADERNTAAQERLLASEERLRLTLEVAEEGLWDWHIEEGVVRHNSRWCTILGLEEGYLTHPLGEFSDLIYPDDRDIVLQTIDEAILGEGKYYSEYRMIRKDGEIIWVVDRGVVVKGTDGKPSRMVGSISDNTQRIKTQQELYLEKEIFRSTLLSAGDGILSTDVNEVITIINPAAETLTGWKKEEAVGRSIYEILDPYQDRMVTRSGKELSIISRVSPIHLPGGEVTGHVVVFRDVTESLARQQKIEYLSFHDELTGLYNRRYLEDALHRLDTRRNLPYAVLVVDLNNLKLTNDVFGHGMGDQMIVKTAALLKDILRAEDIIARVGGDEFCVLLPKTSEEIAGEIHDRIQRTASRYGLEWINLSVASGYAVKTSETEDIDEILHAADTHMYQNKKIQKQRVKGGLIDHFLKSNLKKFDSEKQHNDRVSLYAAALYRALGKPKEEIAAFRKAVQLHDVGKVIISAEILNKKEPLTEEELEIVKRHPLTSYQILRILEESLSYASAILHHHERLDGTGYPEGLSGDAIPLESRVIAIADAYEAMTGVRPYKKTMTKEQAIAELRTAAGSQFDPGLVSLFIERVPFEVFD